MEITIPLLLILGFGALIWKTSKWHSGINHRMEKAENRLDKIETRLDTIGDDISEIFKRLPAKPVESISSPIGLTDYGKELSEQIKAVEIMEMQVDRVKDAVKGFNAYQIQEHCFTFCKNELMSELKENEIDLYNQIHEVAYKEGLDLEKLTRVIALELRDKILSSLSKPHTEIDQYSPD